MGQVTPTPWAATTQGPIIEGKAYEPVFLLGPEPGNQIIAEMKESNQWDNASHIAECVNAHSELVEQVDRNTNRIVNLLQVISDNLPEVAKWHEITEAKMCEAQNREMVKRLRGY